MESKLPKPSGLKRPAPPTAVLTKSILPTDRIKALTGGFGARSATHPLGGSTSMLHQIQPLTRDLTNFQSSLRMQRGGGGRAASPEPTRSTFTTQGRSRLRRSRSACELRAPLKRTDVTVAPIPSKTSRLMTNLSSHNATAPSGSSGGLRPPRFGCASASAITAPANKRPPAAAAAATTTTRAPMGRTGSVAKKPTGGAASTSVSTTGAGKSINKRIPPYDFKARYNDLLEKYKVLKEKHDDKCEQMGNMESLPEQLEESQALLYATQEELKNVQTDKGCLQRQVKSQTLKIDSISSCLVKTKDSLQYLQEEFDKIRKEHGKLTTEVLDLRERTATLTTQNTLITEEVETCKEQLFRSNMERKELHNTVMDLRGNIRVFCRVRPPLDCEETKTLCGWNYLDEATVEIQNSELVGKHKAGAHIFNFDQVFHPNTGQEEIFEMVSPLIQSALDGYNICIFAYGQTGSGKTYTMDGISECPGVIPRTVDLLFDAVRNYKSLGWEYEIKVTFLEIYNEVLYDLLSNEQKDMEIRMAKTGRNDIYVSNITQETVATAGRLRQLMEVAKSNRATAATAGNERSSRSHAVTKIELIGTHAEKKEISVGSINLVDLAGSESPKTSIRMAETKNINRSLSELTNVILALLQKQDHIPYRNSKLTHLLMPSLGGNSKTLMFINVAPFVDCFVESVKSLRFAASVNSCKMAKAKRNRFLNSSSCSSVEK